MLSRSCWKQDTPTRKSRGRRLVSIVDPYAYRDRLTQPKLILLGTNDPFWPVDALNLYWDGLPAPRHVLYVPNNGHGLRDMGRVMAGVVALHRRAAAGPPLPDLSWRFDQTKTGLKLTVESTPAPLRVNAWVAEAPQRDFRRAVWSPQPFEVVDGRHVFECPRPGQGWKAFFGEIIYPDDPGAFFLSTTVRVLGAAAQ